MDLIASVPAFITRLCMQSTELKSIKNNENYVCSFSYFDYVPKKTLKGFRRSFRAFLLTTKSQALIAK